MSLNNGPKLCLLLLIFWPSAGAGRIKKAQTKVKNERKWKRFFFSKEKNSPLIHFWSSPRKEEKNFVRLSAKPWKIKARIGSAGIWYTDFSLSLYRAWSSWWKWVNNRSCVHNGNILAWSYTMVHIINVSSIHPSIPLSSICDPFYSVSAPFSNRDEDRQIWKVAFKMISFFILRFCSQEEAQGVEMLLSFLSFSIFFPSERGKNIKKGQRKVSVSLRFLFQTYESNFRSLLIHITCALNAYVASTFFHTNLAIKNSSQCIFSGEKDSFSRSQMGPLLDWLS